MEEQPEWGKRMSKCFCIPQRVIVAIMGFLGLVNAYTMRISLSLAINTMVYYEKRNASKVVGETICLPDPNDKGEVHSSTGEYDWTEEHQGLILSSFYIGYIITHIPGGVLAERFGGKHVLTSGLFLSAIATCLAPFAVRKGGSYCLIMTRILMGLGQGTTFPALSVLLSAWAPKSERAKLGTFVLSGVQVGTILGTSISGFLLHSYVWDVTFYFWGIIGVVWFILFTLLCYSDPVSHPFIKQEEKEMLIREIGVFDRKGLERPSVPWIEILTNGPVIGLIAAQSGHDWGFYTMVTDLPKYMANVMQFSIKRNGLVSSLPSLIMWIVAQCTAVFSDWLINRNYVTITNARKFFTFLSQMGPGVFMVAASYADCDKFIVVMLFTISMGIMGTYYSGMKINPLDLSPNYAGTLMALANGIGALTGIFAPYFVGLMTPNATLLEWRIVFWVAFFILTGTGAVFVVIGSGEVQPFDKRADTS